MTCHESYESHECILLIAFLIEEGHIFMTRAVWQLCATMMSWVGQWVELGVY